MAEPDHPISRADLLALREAVAARTGVRLELDNLGLLEARLITFARGQGSAALRPLIDAVRLDPHSERSGQVIEALINGETSFFRDQLLFDELRTWVIPQLIERRRSLRRLRLWSAACSSGQEPYSLALLLAEHFADALGGWDVRILATDLSRYAIARAAVARYERRELDRGLGPAQRERWFRPDADGGGTLSPAICRMVELRRLNLLEPWPHLEPMDLVLIRNVMLYWPLGPRRELVTKLAACLQPDGFVALGGAETLPPHGQLRLRVDHRWAFYQLDPR